ncbi:MAG TPA: dihydrofolate reductase family protein [Jiangellaceae bacterium]|nr:dihydrofolate reductase family protein [Jiangellaceae bacterium]
MRTIGSLTLCRSLLVAGLVDRFRVVMFPVITGATGQERIYDGTPTLPSTWWTAAPSTARAIVEYVPRVLHGPAGTS